MGLCGNDSYQPFISAIGPYQSLEQFLMGVFLLEEASGVEKVDVLDFFGEKISQQTSQDFFYLWNLN